MALEMVSSLRGVAGDVDDVADDASNLGTTSLEGGTGNFMEELS